MRGDGLGPGLDDAKLPVGTVFGPFDIHRHRDAGMFGIVGFDPDPDFSKAQHLRVGNAEFLSFGIEYIAGQRRIAAATLAARSERTIFITATEGATLK